jgi:hypothetical protein
MQFYARKKIQYHALGIKNPYEMWNGYIPSVRHLMVLNSTYYALITKEKRSKIGARIQNCIFLWYSNTTKAYHLYDEVKKMCILYRDMFFLEYTKNENTDEWYLSHMNRFTHVNTYHEFDDEIPHLKGGIPILDQTLESFFEMPPPPHEEDPTTSSKQGFQSEDVIERIERLNLYGNVAPY